jgi:hypothetical protein
MHEVRVPGDQPALAPLLAERTALKEQLGKITEALLQDTGVAPRWVAHSLAHAQQGAIACSECGNNLPADDNACAYCGWKYLEESSVQRNSET